MRRWSRFVAVGTGLGMALAVWLAPASAAAYERQWRVGAQAGYTLAGFAGGPSSGFGGGALLSYGVTDYMNLRVHADVSGYDVPDPRSLALIYNGGAGVVFAFDVVQFVPSIGLTVGAAGVTEKDVGSYPVMSVEAPLGLMYYPERDFGIGVEARYRLLLFGPDDGPLHNLTAFARMEYVWGW